MQQQSNHFSLRKKFRETFSAKNKHSNPDGVDPIPSGSIGGRTDVAMSVVKTSLAALKEGSALVANVPFIAPIAGIILQALQMRGEVQQFKNEWDGVMDKLARSANIVIGVGKLCQAHGLVEKDLPDSLRAILKSLQSDLDGIEGALKQCAETNAIKRVLLRADMLQRVRKYDAKLLNILQNFQNELLLDVRFAQIVEKREVNTVAQAEATTSPILWLGPTAPQIFFGRAAELAKIVQMITVNIGARPARIAILGPGGYGKTTLARAVLTTKDIQDNFGSARYFVPCESVTSSGDFLIELGKTLGVLEGGTDSLWFRIQAKLASKDSIICFDNFESPWDQQIETKHSVEELLSRVTELPHVTVIVTMRGAERPAQTHWTPPFLEPLETLDHDSAKEIWQAIAGNYDDFSEKLIEAVDYVPLAVDLLSHLSEVTPPVLLWEDWNSKQTKAVHMGQEHRLSSLEYSIQLSVNSGRMKVNPSARNLLGVLSMLPDGLHMKQLSKFKVTLVDLDIISCLQTLLQCSLIMLIKDRYQPHPIVRHFCLNQDILLPTHKELLEEFYITLALSDFETTTSEVYEELVLEANNIKGTLLGLLESNYNDQARLVHACTQITNFCSNIGDFSDKVISQAVQFVQKSSGSIKLLIMSFHHWGKLYYIANDLERAQEKLKEAEKLCQVSQSMDNLWSHGYVLEDLGKTYLLKNMFNDAEIYYQKALKCQQDGNNIGGQGNSYLELGYLYLRQRQNDKASIFFQNAIQCLEKVNSALSLGNAYRGVGQIYLDQDKKIEAEAVLQKALKVDIAAKSFLHQGNDYIWLGEVYLKLNKPNDATVACQKALESYKMANHTWSQGDAYELLGHIYLSQDWMDKAGSSFKNALELHTVAKNVVGQGNAICGLGHIYLKSGELYDAKRMFEMAIELFKKAQDSSMEKYCIEELDIVLRKMKEGSIG